MSPPEPRKYNVLVFPCASGIAQEVLFALRDKKEFRLHGLNRAGANVGRSLFDNYHETEYDIAKTPDKLAAAIRSLVVRHGIDLIFPAFDDAQVYLKSRETELGVPVATSPVLTTQTCRSKRRTYDLLRDVVRVPTVFPADRPTFPAFAKPDCGEGSRGCFVLRTKEDLDSKQAVLASEEYVVTEYLPGDEFTVDCLSDQEGGLLFCAARKRTLARGGISVITETADRDVQALCKTMATNITGTLQLVGAWFFQVKRDADGHLCLMEVAPRIAGAMALHRFIGVNFAMLTSFIHLQHSVDVVFNAQIENATLYKVYGNTVTAPCLAARTHVYVDLDDTLIKWRDSRPAVNVRVVGFLYSAIETGRRVTLITKHAHCPLATLSKVRLCERLFDGIIHVPRDARKVDFMPDADAAMLVDDSFHERMECAKNNVLAFDVDCVESLSLGHVAP